MILKHSRQVQPPLHIIGKLKRITVAPIVRVRINWAIYSFRQSAACESVPIFCW
jgi:hypothetical protein